MKDNYVTTIRSVSRIRLGLFFASIILILGGIVTYSSSGVTTGKETAMETSAPSPTPDQQDSVRSVPPSNIESIGLNLENSPSSIRATILRIWENGFETNEATLQTGKNLLILVNNTSWDMNLQIRTSTGEIEKNIVVNPGADGWSGVVTLPAGEHSIVSVDNQQYRCTLTVN